MSTKFPEVKDWRPPAQLQEEDNDCGLAATAALAAMYGVPVSADALRDTAGSVMRGMTLRNVRDLLRVAGFSAEVYRIAAGAASNRDPCIALMHGNHFVVLGQTRLGFRDVFDPASGWSRRPESYLTAHVGAYAISVTAVPAQSTVALRRPFPLLAWVNQFRLRRWVAAVSVSIALTQALGIAIPWLSGKILDIALKGQGVASDGAQTVAVAIFAICSMFALVSRSVTAAWTLRFTEYITPAMFGDITRRTFFSHFARLQAQAPSKLVAKILSVAHFRTWVTEELPSIAMNALLVTGVLAMVLWQSPVIALFALAGTGLKALVDWGFRPSLESSTHTQLAAQARHITALTDCMRAIRMLRMYRATTAALQHLGKEAQNEASAIRKGERLQLAQSAAVGVVDVVDRAVFMVVGAALVAGTGVTAGEFLTLALYKETLSSGLNGIRQALTGFRLTQAVASRLEGLVEADKTTITETATPRVGCYAIALDHVAFRYSMFSDEVLSDVSLKVQEGELLAISAPSGAGKSTLARLICGTATPARGSVLVHGVPVTLPNLEGANILIGSVMQDDVIYSGTIRQNIQMFRSSERVDVEDAAKLAAAHEFIMSFPMRYETLISDSTLALSGGQRQRILLARALYGKPSVLVLDEATSHLDLATEGRVLNGIRSLGTTTVIFAHRPETLKAADRVLALTNGALLDTAA